MASTVQWPRFSAEQALGAGGVGGMAGDAVGGFDGLLAGGFGGDGAFDEEGLADMGEGEVIVECCGGPDGAAFDASVAKLGPVPGSRVRRVFGSGIRGR